jgi:cytoskeleton protein RodZ
VVDEQPLNRDETAGLTPSASPGVRLREARERVGLSARDLAARLHLHVAIVEHLEADRFEALPEPAYIRGYLRAAARALEMEEGPLIAAFDAQGLREPRFETPPTVTRGRVSVASRGHRKSPYVVGLVILAAVAVLIGYAWFERQQPIGTAERFTLQERTELAPPAVVDSVPPPAITEPEPTVPPTITAPDTALTEAEPRAEPSPEAVLPPVTADSGIAPEAQSPPAAAALPSAQTEAAAPAEPPAATAGPGELRLVFVEDSWVEVHDAREERLLVGLMREGTERRLSGTPPYRVFLGNAPGVRVQIEGQDYDASRHARADNTARFVLDRP